LYYTTSSLMMSATRNNNTQASDRDVTGHTQVSSSADVTRPEIQAPKDRAPVERFCPRQKKRVDELREVVQALHGKLHFKLAELGQCRTITQAAALSKENVKLKAELQETKERLRNMTYMYDREARKSGLTEVRCSIENVTRRLADRNNRRNLQSSNASKVALEKQVRDFRLALAEKEEQLDTKTAELARYVEVSELKQANLNIKIAQLRRTVEVNQPIMEAKRRIILSLEMKLLEARNPARAAKKQITIKSPIRGDTSRPPFRL